MRISLEELVNATSGKIISKNDIEFSNISTDSRNIKKGDFFVPLSGEKFNGHNFIEKAFINGATGCFIEKNEKIEIQKDKTYIEVENVLKAYQNTATFIREKLNPFVIGITGSSGKTSTKELAYAFLKQFSNVYKTEANFNNEIGVPKTLLEIDESHKNVIIEMGMRGKGQISELANIAKPNIGIITGIGSAHIELLETQENIAEAKWELAIFLLSNNEKIIIPAYDEYLNKLAEKYDSKNLLKINLVKDESSILYMTKNWFENDKQFFEFFDNETKKSHNVLLSVQGKHQISNALLVLALGKILNIEYPDFIDLSFENLSGRSESIKIKNLNITNDSYNANFESMKASIETFINIPSLSNKKIIVLGEMKELGNYSEKYHYELGIFCSSFDFDELIIVGNNAVNIKKGFKNSKSESNKTKIFFSANNLETGKYIIEKYSDENVYILFKGSRGAKLEEIIDFIKTSI